MSESEVLVGEGPARLTLEQGVGHIELNRPDAANGLNIEMLEGLLAVLKACEGDGRIRVVLLSGKGPNFCAGGDVHVFASQGDQLPYYIRKATSLLQKVVSGLIHLDAPVVAAVQGFAAGGGGMGLVCASDIVIASERARFLAGATRVGMAPDAGLSVTLPRLIGPRKAAEFLFSNEPLAAEQALAIGLINQIAPEETLGSVSMAYAKKLAASAPRAVAATKRLLWTGVGLGVDAAMPEESRTVSDLCRTQDVQEGLRAVIEKRKPDFTGR